MATFLYKLGRLSFRRRWWVVASWLVLLVAIGTAASNAGDPPEESFSLPGTETEQAMHLLESEFPAVNAEGVGATVVFQAPEGQELTSPENEAAVRETLSALEGAEGVISVGDPFVQNAGQVSQDVSTAFADIEYEGTIGDVTHERQDELFEAMDLARDAGLTVEASGEIAIGPQEIGGAAELIGVVIAAIVLVITFGSLIAAGLPLVTALVGVVVGILGIAALATTFELSETTNVLAMMIGLAVGIDYALFIASRYRAELIEGHRGEEAAGRAAGTAGSAVVFAGLTVVIALGGLAIVNVPMLTRMGLAAAATVVIAVLIALTLVPAALGIAGKRIFGRRVRRANPETGVPAPSGPDTQNMGTRWSRWILKRPAAVLLVGVVGLGVMAAPVASMELGLPDNSTQPEDTTQRQAYDMLSEGFGPGFNGPLMAVLQGGDGIDLTATGQTLASELEGYEDVVGTTPATLNESGTVAIVSIFPGSSPASSETTDLVSHLRDDFAPDFEAETGTQMFIAGTTAINSDFSQVMNDALVPYLALVVGLAFILLVLVFRSILVPLKAALGFLLSVLASLGVVVAVFQWGWAASLIGVEETSPIMSMMPIFMIGVVFGLAMDYEVFLVTRMREAHVHGEGSHQSVISGFRLNARVVTAAAIIMISVFASFGLTSAEAMITMIGFGLAMAVLLDAFVVRMTLVPAIMGLLGERAWWLPKWLDRILPNVDVEGESLERYLEANGKGRDAVEREREPAGVS